MPIKDITTQVFGRLTALGIAGRSNGGQVLWNCLCSCGKERVVNGENLRNGHTRSCGCLLVENARKNKGVAPKHGHGRNGGSATYNAWHAMKQRCLTKTNKRYADYGGRGITVCPRWMESFENFLTDLGERPKGASLDRINNNGNYEPSNCRWATRKEQQRNMRTSRLISYQGIAKPVAAWAEEIGMSCFALLTRLRRGWSTEDALTRPVSRNARRLKEGTNYGLPSR